MEEKGQLGIPLTMDLTVFSGRVTSAISTLDMYILRNYFAANLILYTGIRSNLCSRSGLPFVVDLKGMVGTAREPL